MSVVLTVPPLRLDLDWIESVARAATAGPWRHSESPYGAVVADAPSGFDDPENVAAYGGHLVAESVRLSNRHFMVAASPDVVLALVAALRDTLRGLPA